MLAAAISTTTSPEAATGSGISPNFRTSGPPCRSMYAAFTSAIPRLSGHDLDRRAVDASLALQIIDGYMRVVPGETRPDAEARGQFRHALLRKPGFCRFT